MLWEEQSEEDRYYYREQGHKHFVYFVAGEQDKPGETLLPDQSPHSLVTKAEEGWIE